MCVCVCVCGGGVEVEQSDSVGRAVTLHAVHRGCIIPQAVTHSLAPPKMGKIIARNMLS